MFLSKSIFPVFLFFVFTVSSTIAKAEPSKQLNWVGDYCFELSSIANKQLFLSMYSNGNHIYPVFGAYGDDPVHGTAILNKSDASYGVTLTSSVPRSPSLTPQFITTTYSMILLKQDGEWEGSYQGLNYASDPFGIVAPDPTERLHGTFRNISGSVRFVSCN